MSSSVADSPRATDDDSRPAPMTPRQWALLLVLCGAIFLEGVDIAMLNIAIPSIRTDLGITTGAAHWVISGYVLGYAGFMLLGGRSADLFGRRRVFLGALTMFIAFSGLGGLADADWMLILARFATGVAAAFMTPAGLSIVTTSFAEGPLRDRAVVVYAATGAAGFTLGVAAGGVLTSVSWRWVFFAPVIMGAVLLAAGRALIRPDEPRPASKASFDLGGAITTTGGMVAIVLGLVLLGESRDIIRGSLALVAAVVLLTTFVILERRSAEPLVRLSIFRQGMVAVASSAGLLYMAAFFGFQFAATLYLQDLLGWSPLETGLAFMIMGLDLILAPLVTPPLVRRFGNAAVMVGGFVAALAAFLLFLRLDADWTYWDLLPSLILVGVAFALAYGPLTLAATEGVDETEQGLAGGILYTAFQFGAAFGLAVVTIALTGGGHGQLGLADYRAALMVPVVLATLAAVTVMIATSRRRRVSQGRIVRQR